MPRGLHLASVAVGRKRNAGEATMRLEAGETRLLLALHTLKECFERFVQAAKNVLAARIVRQSEVASGSNLLQLVRLVVIVDTLSVRCVRFDAFLQGRII
jgi:hypothetical protein